MTAVITDKLPNERRPDPELLESFDQIIWGQEILGARTEQWLFGHDVVEACTAVKGPVLRDLLELGYDAVVYLDPDIAVFAPLAPVTQSLSRHDIVLTPHQLEPDDRDYAILDNEIGSLKHGIFNLGFLGTRATKEGRRFADWWSARLKRFCYAELDRGIFVDQKWCDFVPAFFDNVGILRDAGCNVASWNLNRRTISVGPSGDILVNGVPLRFYHFTKLGPVGDLATMRYAGSNTEVYEIWSWYKREVKKHEISLPNGWWHYGFFSDGTPIPARARVTYRRRPDLQEAFPNPFVSGAGSFQEWCVGNLTAS